MNCQKKHYNLYQYLIETSGKRIKNPLTLFKGDKMEEKTLITKIEKLNNISEKRWLGRFFSNQKWNGHWEREEQRLLKELNKIDSEFPYEFREALRKSHCKKYYCSRNHHNGLWGLDTSNTPQGGGVIAQSKTKEGCLKQAVEVYGINLMFISY